MTVGRDETNGGEASFSSSEGVDAPFSSSEGVDASFSSSEGNGPESRSFMMDSLGESLFESGINVDDLDLSGLIGNEPIEILVELARAGRIDPWNIGIVDVTDTFLSRIEEMQLMDLRISGRTLLYACILLRMKSMALVAEEEEEDIEEIFDDEYDDDIDATLFPTPVLPIRRSARRPVTLKELIDALKKAERSAAQKRIKKEETEPRRLVEADLTTEDVIGIAHDEAILKRTGTLLEILKEMFKTQPYVTLDELLSRPDSERIMDYITLLFIAAMKEIVLAQDEIFGTLYIYPPSAADGDAVPGGDAVPVDGKMSAENVGDKKLDS